MAALPRILRAIPEEGRAWDEPSEDLLLMLLQDIEDGQGSFLIVEQTADPTGQTYAQVLRRPDGCYIVEHRDGDAEHHYGTVVADMGAAQRLLSGWAFDRPGWRDQATWSPVQV
jgi:hypothetical protein